MTCALAIDGKLEAQNGIPEPENQTLLIWKGQILIKYAIIIFPAKKPTTAGRKLLNAEKKISTTLVHTINKSDWLRVPTQ